MPYEVLQEEVTLLRANDTFKNEKNEVTGYDQESVLRTKGEIVEDDQVHPNVVKLYDDGDEHTRSVIKRLSKAQADKKSEGDDDD